MTLYELTYLITPKITDEDAGKFNEEIIEKLKGTGATLYKIENPKKRNLAYDLGGFNEAYIARINFDLSSEEVKLVDEKLKKEEKVLRHLLVSEEFIEKEEEPKREDESEEKEYDEDSDEDDIDRDEEKKKSKKEKKVKLNEIDEKIDEIL